MNTNFCNCTYVLGCRLSLVRLCDSDFGITPVDDITIRTTCASFCLHIAHISFASSWYLFCLSVIVLARLFVFGTAVSIRKVFFVFLFIKVVSGRLKCILLLLLLYDMDVSVTVISSRHFSWTSSDPHRSRFKLHTAVLSVLCVMFQV
jgi:hypothetical protein